MWLLKLWIWWEIWGSSKWGCREVPEQASGGAVTGRDRHVSLKLAASLFCPFSDSALVAHKTMARSRTFCSLEASWKSAMTGQSLEEEEGKIWLRLDLSAVGVQIMWDIGWTLGMQWKGKSYQGQFMAHWEGIRKWCLTLGKCYDFPEAGEMENWRPNMLFLSL